MNEVKVEKRSRGRPVEVTDVVFRTTLALLSQVPINSLSFELIAGTAGVHKTTLYRRWGDMDTLIAGVLDHVGSKHVPMFDTGSLEGDVRQLVRVYARYFRSELGKTINRLLIEHRFSENNELNGWIDAHFEHQHDRFYQIASRARQRKEIRSVDKFMFGIELALGAMLMESLMMDKEISKTTENKLIRISINAMTE